MRLSDENLRIRGFATFHQTKLGTANYDKTDENYRKLYFVRSFKYTASHDLQSCRNSSEVNPNFFNTCP